MAGIDRFIPICGLLLGPNSVTGLNSVADVQRLGLERFHCTCEYRIRFNFRVV